MSSTKVISSKINDIHTVDIEKINNTLASGIE